MQEVRVMYLIFNTDVFWNSLMNCHYIHPCYTCNMQRRYSRLAMCDIEEEGGNIEQLIGEKIYEEKTL